MRSERGGELLVAERETGDDHHAAENEREELQRHDQALVGLDPTEVDERRRPEERERDRQPDRAGLERRAAPARPAATAMSRRNGR
jgi:hypothetical protein